MPITSSTGAVQPSRLRSTQHLALLLVLEGIACGGSTSSGDGFARSETGTSPSGMSSGAASGAASAGGSASGGQASSDSGGGAGAPASDSGGAPTGCKRGLASPTAPTSAFLPNASPPGITWWYNWAAQGAGEGDGIEFVPMMWGSGSFQGATIPHGSRFLLGFNEPNLSAQGSSNLTPQQAADLWPQMEALAKSAGISIVSPAVNLCSGDCVGAPDPYTWLQDFFADCGGCEVDYVAVHFYGCALPTSGEWIGLEDYLNHFIQFNKPIWLTEFSCDSSQTVALQESYMQAAVPYLENNPHIFRYSWFSASGIPNAMLTNADGSLNALGQTYVSLPQNCKL